MKRGLLNLLTLVLVITNVALTAILVFAIVPTMNATTDLVSKVATAIDLEKGTEPQASDTISIDNIATFTFSNKFTVSLLPSGNGQQGGYAQLQITLRLNKSDEAYDKYKDQLADREELMRSVISEKLSTCTAKDFSEGTEKIADEIRDELRNLFNETTFIYSVGISDLVVQ